MSHTKSYPRPPSPSLTAFPRPFFETSPPDPLAIANSPLSGLPRELRDRIYHYLWHPINLIFTSQSLHYDDVSGIVRMVYGIADCDDALGQVPIWLQTNKTILVEGLDQFYRFAKCTSWGGYTIKNIENPSFCIFSPLHIRSIEFLAGYMGYGGIALETGVDLKGDGNLYDVREIQGDGASEIVPLKAGHWIKFLPSAEAGTRAFIVPDYSGAQLQWSPPEIEGLIEALRSQEHGLKRLALKFDFRDEILASPSDREEGGDYYALMNEDVYANSAEVDAIEELWREKDVKEWYVDLSYMENFGTSLDRVEFVVKIPVHQDERSRTDLPERSYEHVYIKLQHELARVAQVLVGGANGSYECRDWVHQLSYRQDWEWHVKATRSETETSSGTLEYAGLSWFPIEPGNTFQEVEDDSEDDREIDEML